MKDSLGKRLRILRNSKNLSIKEVATRIGVPVTTYREWENDRKIVGEPYVDLAKVFEISVYELITGEKGSSEDLSKSFKAIETELSKIKESLLSK